MICLLLSLSHPFSPVISTPRQSREPPPKTNLSLPLLKVTQAGRSHDVQPPTNLNKTHEKSTAPKSQTGIRPAFLLLLLLLLPHCLHMPLMWRDSSILQESLAFRWLRGAWSPDFLPSLRFLSKRLLIYMCTTWPPHPSDLWLHVEESLFSSDVFCLFFFKDLHGQRCHLLYENYQSDWEHYNTFYICCFLSEKVSIPFLSVKVKPSHDCSDLTSVPRLLVLFFFFFWDKKKPESKKGPTATERKNRNGESKSVIRNRCDGLMASQKTFLLCYTGETVHCLFYWYYILYY